MKTFLQQLPICIKQENILAKELSKQLNTQVTTMIGSNHPSYDGAILFEDYYITYELKDERALALKTGNHFLEMISRGKKSGIETTQADYWIVQITDTLLYCTPTKIYKKALKHSKWRVVRGGDKVNRVPSSIGVLVPINWIKNQKETIIINYKI